MFVWLHPDAGTKRQILPGAAETAQRFRREPAQILGEIDGMAIAVTCQSSPHEHAMASISASLSASVQGLMATRPASEQTPAGVETAFESLMAEVSPPLPEQAAPRTATGVGDGSASSVADRPNKGVASAGVDGVGAFFGLSGNFSPAPSPASASDDDAATLGEFSDIEASRPAVEQVGVDVAKEPAASAPLLVAQAAIVPVAPELAEIAPAQVSSPDVANSAGIDRVSEESEDSVEPSQTVAAEAPARGLAGPATLAAPASVSDIDTPSGSDSAETDLEDPLDIAPPSAAINPSAIAGATNVASTVSSTSLDPAPERNAAPETEIAARLRAASENVVAALGDARSDSPIGPIASQYGDAVMAGDEVSRVTTGHPAWPFSAAPALASYTSADVEPQALARPEATAGLDLEVVPAVGRQAEAESADGDANVSNAPSAPAGRRAAAPSTAEFAYTPAATPSDDASPSVTASAPAVPNSGASANSTTTLVGVEPATRPSAAPPAPSSPDGFAAVAAFDAEPSAIEGLEPRTTGFAVPLRAPGVVASVDNPAPQIAASSETSAPAVVARPRDSQPVAVPPADVLVEQSDVNAATISAAAPRPQNGRPMAVVSAGVVADNPPSSAGSADTPVLSASATSPTGQPVAPRVVTEAQSSSVGSAGTPALAVFTAPQAGQPVAAGAVAEAQRSSTGTVGAPILSAFAASQNGQPLAAGVVVEAQPSSAAPAHAPALAASAASQAGQPVAAGIFAEAQPSSAGSASTPAFAASVVPQGVRSVAAGVVVEAQPAGVGAAGAPVLSSSAASQGGQPLVAGVAAEPQSSSVGSASATVQLGSVAPQAGPIVSAGIVVEEQPSSAVSASAPALAASAASQPGQTVASAAGVAVEPEPSAIDSAEATVIGGSAQVKDRPAQLAGKPVGASQPAMDAAGLKILAQTAPVQFKRAEVASPSGAMIADQTIAEVAAASVESGTVARPVATEGQPAVVAEEAASTAATEVSPAAARVGPSPATTFAPTLQPKEPPQPQTSVADTSPAPMPTEPLTDTNPVPEASYGRPPSAPMTTSAEAAPADRQAASDASQPNSGARPQAPQIAAQAGVDSVAAPRNEAETQMPVVPNAVSAQPRAVALQSDATAELQQPALGTRPSATPQTPISATVGAEDGPAQPVEAASPPLAPIAKPAQSVVSAPAPARHAQPVVSEDQSLVSALSAPVDQPALLRTVAAPEVAVETKIADEAPTPAAREAAVAAIDAAPRAPVKPTSEMRAGAITQSPAPELSPTPEPQDDEVQAPSVAKPAQSAIASAPAVNVAAASSAGRVVAVEADVQDDPEALGRVAQRSRHDGAKRSGLAAAGTVSPDAAEAPSAARPVAATASPTIPTAPSPNASTPQPLAASPASIASAPAASVASPVAEEAEAPVAAKSAEGVAEASAKPVDGSADAPEAPREAQAKAGAEPSAPSSAPAREAAPAPADHSTLHARHATPARAHDAHVVANAVGAVATAIAAHAGARRTRFEVRLDPSDLGRVDVRLDIGHDGRVATRLIVDRPETLDLFRQEARELQRTLEQAGFQVGQDGLAFQLRDGRRETWSGPQAQFQSAGEGAAVVEPEIVLPYQRPSRASASGVDMTV